MAILVGKIGLDLGISNSIEPNMQKSDSDELSDEGALQVKMDPEMSPEYEMQDGGDKLQVIILTLLVYKVYI